MTKRISTYHRLIALGCILWLVITSCKNHDDPSKYIYVSGQADKGVSYLTINKDTIDVSNGLFSDTLIRDKDEYNYIKLATWKWPRIIYIDSQKPDLRLDFRSDRIEAQGDKVNQYLLNKDSILVPYTARWNMEDSVFRKSWEREFPKNIDLIDEYFSEASTSKKIVGELKQMELMLRGHLTANFISFQERKGNRINRDIYDFVQDIDLNNERLAFHENNRNFQYYYFLDKVPKDLPDSIYPFAALDTVERNVKVHSIKEMIVRGVVKSGLYNESVNHDSLFDAYEELTDTIPADDPIVQLYDQVQKLKPGHPAPEFGTLLNGDSSKINIDSFKGKNVLISVWGTWCPYCKEELPHLKNLMEEYAHKFESVAISLDTDPIVWQKYIHENSWNGHHLIDPERRSTFKKNYLLSGTNVYYLIDQNGTIVASNIKPSDPALEQVIVSLE